MNSILSHSAILTHFIDSSSHCRLMKVHTMIMSNSKLLQYSSNYAEQYGIKLVKNWGNGIGWYRNMDEKIGSLFSESNREIIFSDFFRSHFSAHSALYYRYVRKVDFVGTNGGQCDFIYQLITKSAAHIVILTEHREMDRQKMKGPDFSFKWKNLWIRLSYLLYLSMDKTASLRIQQRRNS